MVSEITTTANNSVNTSTINDTTPTSIDETNTSDKENSMMTSQVAHADKETYSPRLFDHHTTVEKDLSSSRYKHQDQYEQLQQPQFRSQKLEPPTPYQGNTPSLQPKVQSSKLVDTSTHQSDYDRRIQLQQQSSLQWDDDFAAFANERSVHSRIDLLMDDDDKRSELPSVGTSTGANLTSTPRALAAPSPSSTSDSKPFPKVKPPPSSRPRSSRGARTSSTSTRVETQSRGDNSSDCRAPLPTLNSQGFVFAGNDDQLRSHHATTSTSIAKGGQRDPNELKESSQPKNRKKDLRNDGSSPGMRIRIEERLEEAARRQQLLIQAEQQREDEHLMQLTEWKPASGRGVFIDPASTEDNSVLGGSYESGGQKRILAQFKGCVRCLLE